MSDESQRFRRRARECREIAERTPDGTWREQLQALADDLDREAARIEAEEGPMQLPPIQI